MQKKVLTGRIVLVSPTFVILNVGWEQLHEACVEYDDVLELSSGDETRRVYLKASSSQRESMTHWDDPEVQLLWLAPFVGDRHIFAASPGSRMRLAVKGKLGERDEAP